MLADKTIAVSNASHKNSLLDRAISHSYSPLQHLECRLLLSIPVMFGLKKNKKFFLEGLQICINFVSVLGNLLLMIEIKSTIAFGLNTGEDMIGFMKK